MVSLMSQSPDYFYLSVPNSNIYSTDFISVDVENTTNPLSEMGDNQLNNQIQNEGKKK